MKNLKPDDLRKNLESSLECVKKHHLNSRNNAEEIPGKKEMPKCQTFFIRQLGIATKKFHDKEYLKVFDEITKDYFEFMEELNSQKKEFIDYNEMMKNSIPINSLKNHEMEYGLVSFQNNPSKKSVTESFYNHP